MEAGLPHNLSVLFVDDDPILRKLFSRKLKTVAPDWTVREAANGETALVLVERHSFDLIFMDQYMASVEKQVRCGEELRMSTARVVLPAHTRVSSSP
jgi:CheY-like chemotaxis protein